MARFGLVSLLASTADGARVVTGARAETSANASMGHPIPTPEGYSFNWDYVYGCYAGALAGANSDVPPGYKVSKDAACAGTDIKKWKDGGESFFGKVDTTHQYRDVLECARECNRHEECMGFHTYQGICSHWRAGELQDTKGVRSKQHNCYVKWEVRDLSGEAGTVPRDEPAPPQPVPKPKGPQVSDCLCVWDIDRTLTAKQGWDHCPGSMLFPGVHDYAYLGGKFIMSDLFMRFNETFCNECYFGVVSAGTASGPSSAVRIMIDGAVQPKYNIGGWVDGCPHPVWGSKVMCCGEGEAKVQAVRDIQGWLGQNNVTIKDENVHFFDDKANNIEAFQKYGPEINAHMVSCGSRDGSRGGCGGVVEEVRNIKGQHAC